MAGLALSVAVCSHQFGVAPVGCVTVALTWLRQGEYPLASASAVERSNTAGKRGRDVVLTFSMQGAGAGWACLHCGEPAVRRFAASSCLSVCGRARVEGPLIHTGSRHQVEFACVYGKLVTAGAMWLCVAGLGNFVQTLVMVILLEAFGQTSAVTSDLSTYRLEVIWRLQYSFATVILLSLFVYRVKYLTETQLWHKRNDASMMADDALSVSNASEHVAPRETA